MNLRITLLRHLDPSNASYGRFALRSNRAPPYGQKRRENTVNGVLTHGTKREAKYTHATIVLRTKHATPVITGAVKCTNCIRRDGIWLLVAIGAVIVDCRWDTHPCSDETHPF